MAGRIIAQPAVSLDLVRRIVNADLAMLDDQSNPYPYLAEALPQLNSGSWKVFPDGRMETTYHLRPNLVWHDGTPLTADDFVFSLQVYNLPEVGQANSVPFKAIASVEASDERTILIHWNQPYAAAGALQSLGSSGPIGLPALPRHLLSSALDAGAQALINSPFWTQDYVGLGPYKLERWESGAFLEASAFDRHALGAPKIQRIKIQFMPDPNAALASMLAGEIQMAADSALPLAQALNLIHQWAPGTGTMVSSSSSWIAGHFQNRPDFVTPATLKDVRVRQALYLAADRQGINDALWEGQVRIADSMFPSSSELGRAVDAATTKYPFDLSRSAQLMTEAGFIRGTDGFFVGPNGEKFLAELRTEDRADRVAPMTALASGWRKGGFDFTEYVVPNAQTQDNQVKSSYPGILMSATAGGENAFNSMGTSNVSRPENQWRGSAWDGYANPELDRLIAAFTTALDPADRVRVASDIVRLYSRELPS
ncbi:MAG TPA: ABC transporter substrate-binding protein, partial [Chloroflexota bacterium]